MWDAIRRWSEFDDRVVGMIARIGAAPMGNGADPGEFPYAGVPKDFASPQ